MEDEGCCTEKQICSELEVDGLNSFIKQGVARRDSEQTVLDDLNSISVTLKVSSLDVKDWIADGQALEGARARVAAAAIARKWFKEVEGGRALGRWLMKYAAHRQLAATIGHLTEVRDFVYSAAPAEAEEEGDPDGPSDG